MRNRQPADQRLDPYVSRTGGTMARSPSERLEPTRPPARPRRRRDDRTPRRASPFVRFVNGLLTFILLLMLLVGAAAYVFDSQIDAAGPLQQGKTVVIPKNEGTLEIAARLEREGIVTDRRLFVVGYRWTQLAAMIEGTKPVPLKAGDYAVKQNASVRQVIDLLSEGKTMSYRVTIPEGLTSHVIIERLKADANLSGEIEGVPPEGSLLPETFIVERGMARQAVVDRMQAEARKLQEKAWAQRKKDLPLKSLEEALVLASIVEKETGRGDERDRVAAVFINRLKQNMRLQSDPTILYGQTGGKTVWNRPIQKNEIAQKTSHNTYQIDGLPPTPICNPGRAAIEAVLNPADTKELYFVADGNGGHVFSETLKDHNANVQKWRAAEKDMKGRAVAPATADTPTTAAPAQPPAKTRAVVRTVPSTVKPPAETPAPKKP
jgi:peptidoglycan lytic transglycosylase G